MAFMFICSARVLVCCLEMLYIVLIFVMNFLCVLPQAPTISINIGFTFQPLVLILFMRFSIFFVFFCFFFL
jgi:hypothetical protein